MIREKVSHKDHDTQQRVLESACEIFALKGFKDASITDICEHAQANRAAVNYYFRDKSQLYEQAWRYAWLQASQAYPFDSVVNNSTPAQEVIELFITVVLKRIFCTGKAGWFPQMMVREMADPTDAFEGIFQDIIRPQFKLLSQAIQQIVGPDVAQLNVHLAVMSIVSQCIYFSFNKAVRQRHFDGNADLARQIEVLTRHIIDFSLAGILNIKTGNIKMDNIKLHCQKGGGS